MGLAHESLAILDLWYYQFAKGAQGSLSCQQFPEVECCARPETAAAFMPLLDAGVLT